MLTHLVCDEIAKPESHTRRGVVQLWCPPTYTVETDDGTIRETHDALSGGALVHFAANYILVGPSIASICDHNSNVAHNFGRLELAQIWLLVKLLYDPHGPCVPLTGRAMQAISAQQQLAFGTATTSANGALIAASPQPTPVASSSSLVTPSSHPHRVTPHHGGGKSVIPPSCHPQQSPPLR